MSDLEAKARELANDIGSECLHHYESGSVYEERAAETRILRALRTAARETMQSAIATIGAFEVDRTQYCAARYEDGVQDGLDRAQEALKMAMKELESRDG